MKHKTHLMDFDLIASLDDLFDKDRSGPDERYTTE